MLRRRRELVAHGGLVDAALRRERCERLADTGRAQAARPSELRASVSGRSACARTCSSVSRGEGAGGGVDGVTLHDVQRQRVVDGGERERQAVGRRGRPMLGAE